MTSLRAGWMSKIRTRARTVDMLGRQQIAGIPNAISELFKNAHDAYATRVEADFYRPENLLVLRDNGLGMTLKDVEDRWLVLGTESKMTGDRELDAVAEALDMDKRFATGEKGIGRLAIAAIGPQVLLLTRARREDGLHSSVAAFVNWTLFTLPGISLDEIEIPVKEFQGSRLPSTQDIRLMVNIVRINLNQLRRRIDPDSAREIDQQLDGFSVDPSSLQSRFQETSLAELQTGTQFFIQPTDPMLEIALDATPERRRVGELQRMLIGFTNTMMPQHFQAPVATEFRDHRTPDFSESIIGAEAFFTPEEFESADHHFQGQFDEFGQFSGTVSVYGSDPEPHEIVWQEARGRKTDCGPFSIDFAYVQGAARDSHLEPEQWNRLATKLDSMGGLYIYRNGIRILPYGNTENDFLRIEERRNLGAAYYFFSYRRIIGAIDLPVASSDKLIEKAGREGFRQNRAYQQFRAILQNFFVQLAADYFRDESIRGTRFVETRTELNRQVKARQLHARQARSRRAEFVLNLQGRGERLRNEEPNAEVKEILEDLNIVLQGAHATSDPDLQAQTVLQAEETARQRVLQLRSQFRAPSVRGFGLTRALRGDLNAYSAEFSKLDRDVLTPALERIGERLSEAIAGMRADVSRRRRFDHNALASQNAAKTAVLATRRDSEGILNQTAEKVRSAIRAATASLDTALRDIEQRVQRADLSALSDSELVNLSTQLESEIEALAHEKRELLDAITQQLEAINVSPDETGQIVTQLDVVGDAEEQLMALQERAEADLELTHLGMAIEIIDHEFQSTIRAVRNNLRRLRAWADVNADLQTVYDGIRLNFEHLDSYLTLFTPLHRRLYKTETEIKGSEINKFLQDLFRERFARHQVSMHPTRAFLAHRMKGYPSTFYPVFVNLVDNATFWLRDREHPRLISLDSDGIAMFVSDNGPGIPTQDREAVFEMGFTRKPGGRGLGLYISRDVLRQIDYDLIIANDSGNSGTKFIIRPTDNSDVF